MYNIYHNIGVAPIMQLCTHTCVIKILTFKGGHPICGKNVFSYHKELLLKKIIRSQREQILSFKRSSHFKRDVIEENHCLIEYIFSAFWLRHCTIFNTLIPIFVFTLARLN